ncbi:MAG: lytic transglycosylase domain-containing protein [Janthinobacterium lividum]
MIPLALLACAANVSPVTLEAIVRVESKGNPLALYVNHYASRQPHPSSIAEAASTAENFIAQGYSVDIGLLQINSSNLAGLGYTIEQALDPCTNIRGGAAILTANYADAARDRGEGQAALKAALSAYNTGSFYRGFANGYVAKYYGPNGVPALAGGVQQAAAVKPAAPPPPPNPYTADTQVYVREASSVHVD